MLSLFLLLPAFASAAMPAEEITALQRQIADRPVGERIAFWAETFIDTPYDPDPLGEYVRKGVIVADERVDCMYLTFRAVELALSKTSDEAISVALDKRFITAGNLSDGRVVNYEERFRYGEDMVDSPKWGTEITGLLGETVSMPGIRGRETIAFLAGEAMFKATDLLRSGDIIFFVNPPQRMPIGGIIGHMGIIKREESGIYLIHASGIKNRGGEVKKVLASEYLHMMPFIGIRVSRFGGEASPSK